MTDHSIKGKTVIIAGGAKNLGGLIARDLAAHGAKAIAIHYNSAASKADADATVAAVKAAGAEAVTRGVINNTGVIEAGSLTQEGGGASSSPPPTTSTSVPGRRLRSTAKKGVKSPSRPRPARFWPTAN